LHYNAGSDKVSSIEGAITIGFAFVGFMFTLPFPDQLLSSGNLAGFTRQELEMVLDRVERDRGDAEPDKLTKEKVFKLALTWELWVYGKSSQYIIIHLLQNENHNLTYITLRLHVLDLFGI
jgi:hypothetical protein